jgi:hypothetical protein
LDNKTQKEWKASKIGSRVHPEGKASKGMKILATERKGIGALRVKNGNFVVFGSSA